MKSSLLRLVGKGINNILSLFGFRINKIIVNEINKTSKSIKENFVWQKASILPEASTIIDIGIGPKGTKGLYQHFPDAQYVFIDPLEECRTAVIEYLKNDKNVFISTAIGSTDSKVSINIARKPSRSSLLKRKHHHLSEGVDSREVPVKRLDNVLEKLDLKEPLGIKIDTEGYELEVLKGAPLSLAKAIFVIIEFHLNDARNNNYTLQDLIDHMNNAGFSAYMMLKDGRNIVFLADALVNDF